VVALAPIVSRSAPTCVTVKPFWRSQSESAAYCACGGEKRA
jgi:hypothetical protein